MPEMRLPNIDHNSGLPRPVWRGRLHAAAAMVAIPAGATLIAWAKSPTAETAAVVYVVAMIAVYATSASYHLLARTPRSQRVMQRCDHAMIYMLVAGSATPLCLLAAPSGWRAILLVFSWCAAACGVVLKATKRAEKFASALYLVIGWAAAATVPSLMGDRDIATAVLVVVGGVVYSLGALMFSLGRPKLRPEVFGYHEVWHVLTLVAGAAHFVAISRLVS